MSKAVIRDKIRAMEGKERISKTIENVKQTIADIQKTVKETQIEKETKRNTIESELEKSIDDRREKIRNHEKSSVDIEKETGEMKVNYKRLRINSWPSRQRPRKEALIKIKG